MEDEGSVRSCNPSIANDEDSQAAPGYLAIPRDAGLPTSPGVASSRGPVGRPASALSFPRDELVSAAIDRSVGVNPLAEPDAPLPETPDLRRQKGSNGTLSEGKWLDRDKTLPTDDTGNNLLVGRNLRCRLTKPDEWRSPREQRADLLCEQWTALGMVTPAAPIGRNAPSIAFEGTADAIVLDLAANGLHGRRRDEEGDWRPLGEDLFTILPDPGWRIQTFTEPALSTGARRDRDKELNDLAWKRKRATAGVDAGLSRRQKERITKKRRDKVAAALAPFESVLRRKHRRPNRQQHVFLCVLASYIWRNPHLVKKELQPFIPVVLEEIDRRIASARASSPDFVKIDD